MKRKPTNPAKHLESELWAARLGFCSEWQLDVLPGCVDGVPSQFEYHPFRFITTKQQAQIRKRAAGRSPQKMKSAGQRFYMDFGFLRASTSDYSRPNLDEDRIVESFDGFSSYLLVVDEVSHHLWVFLCTSKEPPLDIVSTFLEFYGLEAGGLVRCDQGGELARSKEFLATVYAKQYIVEPTGSDDPAANACLWR